VDANWLTIEKDEHVLWRVQLITRQQGRILHAKINRYLQEGLFGRVRGHMGRKGQVFDQTAGLSFWRV
jgi:hypothetical protein